MGKDNMKKIDGRYYFKSKYTKNWSRVYISDGMTGKMQDIPATSTSCHMNPRCIARSRCPELVCFHCFADSTLNQYDALDYNLMVATNILTQEYIAWDDLPEYKDNVEEGRWEAFGDIINELQVINYLNTTAKNPHVDFALWSKNPDIIKRAFDRGYEKPKNLTIIYSSPKVNEQVKLEDLHKAGFTFIDKTFTVWEHEYALEHNIPINCCDGTKPRQCKYDCGLCYHDKTVTEINETLRPNKAKLKAQGGAR